MLLKLRKPEKAIMLIRLNVNFKSQLNWR